MDTLSATTVNDAAMASEAGLDDFAGDDSDSDYRYVQIILYSARHLLAKDYSGYSDPYVEGRLVGEKIRSRVVQQTTNPNWNQEYAAFSAGLPSIATCNLHFAGFTVQGMFEICSDRPFIAQSRPWAMCDLQRCVQVCHENGKVRGSGRPCPEADCI